MADSALVSSELYFNPTYSDSVDLAKPSREIRVAQAGDLAVQRLDGTSVTIPAMQAGERLTIKAKKILATGTTIAAGQVFVMT